MIISWIKKLIERKKKEEENTSLNEFLTFLSKDVKKNPERIRPIDEELFLRAQLLVEGVDVEMEDELLEKEE